MLTVPPWVDFGRGDRGQLRFTWDDARFPDELNRDSSDLLSAATKLSVRARLAVLVGLYEWVVWRFDGLHQRAEPVQILEAAWCGTVDPRYLAFFELTREEWTGPVEGPLWCAFTWLHHGFFKMPAFPGDLYDALDFLYRLAVHVVPDPAALERWLGPILDRAAGQSPLHDEDPFEDLFERRIGERLGPIMARPGLDPARPANAALDRAFLSRVMEDAVAGANPFLATPEDLEELGFEGTPFRLPDG